jgi:integrase
MTNSTDSLSARKPEKPDPDFPLTPRADGRWMKKIHGKLYYFTGESDEARRQYEDLVERLGKDEDTRHKVRDLCNLFLTSKKTDLEAGQIAQRTFDDYRAITDRIVAHFGRLRPLEELSVSDAEALRKRLIKGVSLKTQSNRIQRARCVFKWGVDRLILDKPFHLWLKTVPRKKLRQHKQQQPSRILSADELRQLIEAAPCPLKAMILLGVNCGFGNSDCADLAFRHLDLDDAWHDFPRPKTGESRRGRLWPETVAAIRDAVAKRPRPRQEEHDDRVFLTKYGTLWVKEDRKTSPLSSEFRKLAQEERIYRPGVSFYSLRHVFETVAGGSTDQVAVNYVMGHVDESIAREYRHSIEDERLELVADYVHQWLFQKPAKGGGRPHLRIVG